MSTVTLEQVTEQAEAELNRLAALVAGDLPVSGGEIIAALNAAGRSRNYFEKVVEIHRSELRIARMDAEAKEANEEYVRLQNAFTVAWNSMGEINAEIERTWGARTRQAAYDIQQLQPQANNAKVAVMAIYERIATAERFLADERVRLRTQE